MGDRHVFEATYLKYYPVLLVYGKAIAQNEQLVEDTIQELFLSFWKNKVDLSEKSSLENYLIVSLRNNLIRKLKTPRVIELDLNLPDEDAADLINSENEPKLAALLEQLPPRQREVLFLRYYKNKPYEEIADMLGINYQVVRNFSYRALQFLRKNMKNLKALLILLNF